MTFFRGLARWLSFCCVLVAGPVLAATETGNPALDKAVGHLLAAFNATTPAAREAALRQALSDSALEQIPLAEQATLVAQLHRQSGGFTLVMADTDAKTRSAHLHLRSRLGGYPIHLRTRLDSKQTGKLAGFGFKVEDRGPKAPDWPWGKLGDEGKAKAIAARVDWLSRQDRFSGVVLVAKDDELLFQGAYGFADRGLGVKNSLDTKFNLGSMNKMFTSVAIGQLVDAGKLAFDSRLSEVLPDYPNRAVAEKITIRQLLSHTSGLGDIFKPELFRERQRFEYPRDYFPLFAQEPLLFEPGSDWDYSNAGFVVLGAVIERLSGLDYFDYVRQHIYAPAGMSQSDSYALDEVVSKLAVGYHHDRERDPLNIEARRSNVLTLPWRGSPAGGGYATAPDLLKFAQALREHQLVSNQTREQLWSAQHRFDPEGLEQYAHGFELERVGDHWLVGHSGGADGVNAKLMSFRDGSYTVIVLGNYEPPLAQNLCQDIYHFLVESEKA